MMTPVMHRPHLKMKTAGSVNVLYSRMVLDTCTSVVEAITQFHRFNHEKEASKMCSSKLMLYLPWRNENTDLLGRYP